MAKWLDLGLGVDRVVHVMVMLPVEIVSANLKNQLGEELCGTRLEGCYCWFSYSC